jgi:hypothetical protein
VGGVLFGTDSALIKRGGDWGNVQGSANFTFPATVSLPTNVLRFEVSDISDRMALEIFDFQLQLLVPVEGEGVVHAAQQRKATNIHPSAHRQTQVGCGALQL